MKNQNIEKKRWRPGRNLLTLILLILIIIIVFIAIYIPVTITNTWKENKTTPFQDHETLANLESVYDEEKIEYIDYKDFEAESGNFRLSLRATDYLDNKDDVYNKDSDKSSGDKITFVLAVGYGEDGGIKKDATYYSAIQGTHMMYAALSVSTNWVGDHAVSSKVTQIIENNIADSKEVNMGTLQCNVSYPVKKTICWPFTKTIETPDVYLYLYYQDAQLSTNSGRHQYVIKFTYDEYMDSSTNGGIIKIK